MPIPFIVKSAKGLSLNSMKNSNMVGSLTHRFMIRKASYVWNHIEKQITGKKILDVGMGAGSTSFFLTKKGLRVTGVDVDNLSIYEDLKPVIYDGHKLPFKNNEFDTAVIVHVLHHCSDGLGVLREAKRVAKRVIFIEDTYNDKIEWLFLQFNDAITNFEFKLHKFRTIKEWDFIVRQNGWKLISKQSWFEVGVSSLYSRYCMFVVE